MAGQETIRDVIIRVAIKHVNEAMKAYFFIKGFTTSEDKWFGLDSSAVKIEKVPLIIRPAENIKLKRIYS